MRKSELNGVDQQRPSERDHSDHSETVTTYQDRRSVLKAVGALGTGGLAARTLTGRSRASDCTLPSDNGSYSETSYVDKIETIDTGEQFYRPHSQYYSAEHRQALLYLGGNKGSIETTHYFAIYGYSQGNDGSLSTSYDPYPVIDKTQIDINLNTGDSVDYDPWYDLGGRPDPNGLDDTYAAISKLYTVAKIALAVGGNWAPGITESIATAIIRGSDTGDGSKTHFWEWNYTDLGECVSEAEHVLYFNVPNATNDYVDFTIESKTDCSNFGFSAGTQWNVYASFDAYGNPYMNAY